MANVLIIDDDPGVCRTLAALLKKQGYAADCAASLDLGFAALKNAFVDLVVLDVHLPDGNGLEKIAAIAQTPSQPDIVIMTAQGDPDGAETALHSGAWDYIEKSDSPKAIAGRIARILDRRAATGSPGIDRSINREGIVGNSPPMTRVLKRMAQTFSSDAGVLITGETGTGKELFAQAVHRNSPRQRGNFVVVDCAALPKTLVESVLFGHVRGAYTGADTPREGLVLQAHGGTLFLDEVGEMPLDLQRAFLRVLESHRFRPIGGKKELFSDFRLIASTNQNLDEMVQHGDFRNDLLYRLRTFHLKLPALRHRGEDIHAIALHHIDRLNTLYGRPAVELSPDFLEMLQAYDWPGNVRELVNAVEYALAAAGHEIMLYDYHLPTQLRAKVARTRLSRSLPATNPTVVPTTVGGSFPTLQDFREKAVADAEVKYLDALMKKAGGNMSTACTLSGLSRSRLYELLKKHTIKKSP